jgi:YVTN family beta-propeller protein
MKLSTLLATALSALVLGGPAALAGDFTHYESSHVHPLALDAEAGRLVAVNTPEARLALFDVDAEGSLVFVGDVPVGLEPVSVALRPGTPEAWVVNHLSDSVSVVDTAAARLVATLSVGDEPTDVVFASGRAFISLAGRNDHVVVYEAESRERVTAIEGQPAWKMAKLGTVSSATASEPPW